jgi:hypothetical protein
MAAVSITITGVLYDKLARTTRPVTLIGDAIVNDLAVGGGPIIPEQPPGSGGPPLGTWGGDAPWPGYGTPPIYIPDPKPPELPPAEVIPPGGALVIAKDPNGNLSWVVMYPGGKPPTTPQPKPA